MGDLFWLFGRLLQKGITYAECASFGYFFICDITLAFLFTNTSRSVRSLSFSYFTVYSKYTNMLLSVNMSRPDSDV